MKSKFPGPVPEIPVRDINKAAAYYQRNLGFTLDWGGEELGLAGISKASVGCFWRTRSLERNTATLDRY